MKTTHIIAAYLFFITGQLFFIWFNDKILGSMCFIVCAIFLSTYSILKKLDGK